MAAEAVVVEEAVAGGGRRVGAVPARVPASCAGFRRIRRGMRCSVPLAKWWKTDGLAELAIPFKSLRHPTREAGLMHRWGFQIVREISSKDESVVWGTGVEGHPRISASDGCARRDERLVHEQKLEPAAFGNRHRNDGPESNDGDLRGRRDVKEGGVGLKLRRDVKPHGRLHVQSRLLADRVRSRADRSQSAVPGLLPGAQTVLSRRSGNLQYPLTGDASSTRGRSSIHASAPS